MSATAFATPEVTVYQAAWDERKKKHNRLARMVNYGFLTVFLGIFAWLGIELFNMSLILSSSADLAVKQDAARVGATWVVGFVVTMLFIGVISMPFFRAVNWSEWGLGERPGDDFKPREAKALDVTIEQVNDDLRLFHVSGLFRSGSYTFEVTRTTQKKMFRQPKYSYGIVEQNNKIREHATFDRSCFKDMNDSEITQRLIQHISFKLEDQTSYFKELSYAI